MCVCVSVLAVGMHVCIGWVCLCVQYTIYAASSLCGGTMSTAQARRGADKSKSAEQGDRNPDSTLSFLCVCVCVCCMCVCVVCVCVSACCGHARMYWIGLFTCSIYTIYAASSLRGGTVSTTRARRGTSNSQSAEQGDRNPDSTLS